MLNRYKWHIADNYINQYVMTLTKGKRFTLEIIEIFPMYLKKQRFVVFSFDMIDKTTDHLTLNVEIED